MEILIKNKFFFFIEFTFLKLDQTTGFKNNGVYTNSLYKCGKLEITTEACGAVYKKAEAKRYISDARGSGLFLRQRLKKVSITNTVNWYDRC